jgi:hypothetical protein
MARSELPDECAEVPVPPAEFWPEVNNLIASLRSLPFANKTGLREGPRRAYLSGRCVRVQTTDSRGGEGRSAEDEAAVSSHVYTGTTRRGHMMKLLLVFGVLEHIITTACA